jgi:tetratricopeptide (TPR) repeat protein
MRVMFLAGLVCAAAPAMAQETSPCSALGPACDAAIELAPSVPAQADLLYRRAYQKVENNDILGARDDLNRAVKLDPENPKALRERAYVNNELGDYAQAEQDLEARAKLVPPEVGFYQERAYARLPQAKVAEAFADRVKVVELLPEDSLAMLMRGSARMWLGQLEEAGRDIDRGRALAQKTNARNLIARADELSRELEAWTTNSGPDAAANCAKAAAAGKFDQKNLVGDCTAAYLAAKDGPAKAEALTARSTAWLVGLQDQGSSTEDKQLAVGFDPANPDRHSNLGYAYVQARHSWAGEREFDKAIALKKTWTALAGRAAARLNLRNKDGAKEDALASLDIQPNELAYVVLGDIAMLDPPDRARAKTLWMSAWKLGNRGDGLMERLASVGVADPAKEP